MNGKGFGLFDLVVTSFLILVLAGFGVGYLEQIGEQHRLQLASQSLLSTLSMARGLSIAKNLGVEVRIHPDRSQYALLPVDTEEELWRQFPRGVELTQFPDPPITFYSRGTATPSGTFTLVNSAGTMQVVVALSGRARWERVD
ncbi:MAG: GspH/FimT family pseudopilin [Acidobacteriota bacterium]